LIIIGNALLRAGSICAAIVKYRPYHYARHAEHIKFFATTDAAETWFEENDPEGVAFENEVLE
jgi:hypothetical protein